ncbi:MAG: hypothetical protein KQ78_02000 [Candidatus Izimaplasma bacterium HR2]|nr:MAG: hypothetical protein KQ78_02000 [Candidatus Izimaplasma bacterium HR2]
MSIDLLLEKWLTAFNKYGKTLEIFENPSAKEFRNLKTSFRFILDSKHKKIYVWSAMGAIHADTWVHIKKELNDSRQLSKSGTLLAGTNWIYFALSPEINSSIKKELKETDWSFATRWIDIKKLQKLLDEL